MNAEAQHVGIEGGGGREEDQGGKEDRRVGECVYESAWGGRGGGVVNEKTRGGVGEGKGGKNEMETEEVCEGRIRPFTDELRRDACFVLVHKSSSSLHGGVGLAGGRVGGGGDSATIATRRVTSVLSGMSHMKGTSKMSSPVKKSLRTSFLYSTPTRLQFSKGPSPVNLLCEINVLLTVEKFY